MPASMSRPARLGALVLLTSLLTAPLAAQGAPSAPPLASLAAADSAAAVEFGRQLTDWLWAAEADSIWANMSDEMRGFMRSPGNIADQIFGFAGQFGVEASMVTESVARQGENFVYSRVSKLEAADKPWTISWTWRPDSKVINIDLQPGE